MEDKGLKINIEKPLKLELHQEWICEYLDCLNEKEKICAEGVLPSDLIKGALSVILNKDLNPDWMAQSAHSYREILCGFFISQRNKNSGTKITNIEMIGELMKILHEKKRAQEIACALNNTYRAFTKIAHHFSEKNSRSDTVKIFEKLGIVINDKDNFPRKEDFQLLIQVFENIIKESSLDPLKIHEKIDYFIKENNKDYSYLRLLFSLNYDARRYYFFRADESWLNWLWQNDFLEIIKEKAKDPTSYSHSTPELNYIVRMAEKNPIIVADIVISVPISAKTFNPEVISQFLQICSKLPAKQLALIAPKIYKEKWISLMKGFGSHFGFKFKEMFKTLAEAKDSRTALVLCKVLLEVQENKNEEKNKNIWTDNPFYFGDLEYSGIFDFLEKIEEKHIEEALSLVTETMEKIIILNKDNRDSRDAFKIGDGFALYDTDFFALKLRQKKHLSHNDDVRDLMAIFKNLLSRILSNNPEKTRKIFNTYITTLPDSQAMWRFRLFLFSLNTDIFSKEIKNAIFRIFEVKNPHDLTMGPEYYHLLQKTFLHLSKKTRREYIELVFKKLIGIKAKELYKSDVLKIFSSIYKELTEEDKNKAKEYLGRSLANEYNPEPLIGSIRGGFVKSQSIISAEELALMSVTDIAKKLCEEWDPKKLTRRDEFGDDFLSYDADGLSKAIQEDMAKRLQKYIKNAPLFYDKENLDEHYTYSFFNSVREIIRENKTDLSIDWDGLFTLFSIFIDPSQEKSIISGKCERRGSIWLAGWDAVHSAVADLLKELLALRENKVSIIDFNKYRNQLFAVIEYLSEHPNPDPQSEVCTPREDYSDRKDGKIKYDCSDPFTHAINSVRGKTFDALVRFMERDSKRFPKKASVKISPDVKKLYENILSQENTRAIMFLLGHYLPSFYFRDKKWTKKLFDRLFNFEPSKRDLSLAAWEGYLTNNLYYELFQELEEYYSKAMKMNRDDYTPREYFKDLDEALANHIALGFMHFSEFTLKSELFLQFWKEKSIKRQKEFVSFVGRYAISRNQAEDWLKKNRIDVKKIENLWNWILGANLEREIYETFGYWIDAEGENFKPKWQSEHILETLKKTDGKIEWDNELQQALPALAKVSPKNTIEILKLYLLNYLAVKTEDQGWIHIDDNMLDVFKVLYNNPDTKQETRNLVSALLPYGNGLFWRLEDALK